MTLRSSTRDRDESDGQDWLGSNSVTNKEF
jgi:hypothetical protein